MEEVFQMKSRIDLLPHQTLNKPDIIIIQSRQDSYFKLYSSSRFFLDLKTKDGSKVTSLREEIRSLGGVSGCRVCWCRE